jgi:hypothetical protein
MIRTVCLERVLCLSPDQNHAQLVCTADPLRVRLQEGGEGRRRFPFREAGEASAFSVLADPCRIPILKRQLRQIKECYCRHKDTADQFIKKQLVVLFLLGIHKLVFRFCVMCFFKFCSHSQK